MDNEHDLRNAVTTLSERQKPHRQMSQAACEAGYDLQGNVGNTPLKV